MRIQKKSAGFALIEVMLGIVLAGVALGVVSVARQKREMARKQLQTSIEQVEQERVKVEEETKATPKKEPETDTKEDTVARSLPKNGKRDMSRRNVPGLETSGLLDADERDREKAEGNRPQRSSHDTAPRDQKDLRTSDATSDQDASVPFQLADLCFPGSPFPLCAIPGFSEYWYLQAQEQQEAQQQLNEQYYYYEQQQVFDPNQFMQDPYQHDPALQNLYQQTFPGLYQQFFPGGY